VDFTHTTVPAHSGTYHFFEVRGPHGAVLLSLLHSRHPGFAAAGGLSPQAASRLAPTDGGYWVFDLIQTHVPAGPDSGWSCSRHGDRCDMDAIVGDLADPIWEHLCQVGVTDASVRAQLEPLHERVFGEVAA